MLAFFYPANSDLFNNIPRHEHWASQRPSCGSYEDLSLPFHVAQSVAEVKPPHVVRTAGPEDSSAVYDTSDTAGADPPRLISPFVNRVSVHPTLPGPPSVFDSHQPVVVNDSEHSCPKFPAGSSPSRGSLSPRHLRSPISARSDKEFNCQPAQISRLQQEIARSSHPIAMSSSGSEVNLFPSNGGEDGWILNPTGAVLTQAVQDVINEALALYDSFRSLDSFTGSAGGVCQRGATSPKADDLEHQFMVVVDARNALTFRQYAILADIGLCLESLDAKLSLYAKDEATLSSAIEDLDHIKQQASEWKLNIPFNGLEHHPSLLRSYGASFKERYLHLYEEAQPLSGKYKRFQHLAHQFMKDPAALTDHRLLKLSTLQQ